MMSIILLGKALMMIADYVRSLCVAARANLVLYLFSPFVVGALPIATDMVNLASN